MVLLEVIDPPFSLFSISVTSVSIKALDVFTVAKVPSINDLHYFICCNRNLPRHFTSVKNEVIAKPISLKISWDLRSFSDIPIILFSTQAIQLVFFHLCSCFCLLEFGSHFETHGFIVISSLLWLWFLSLFKYWMIIQTIWGPFTVLEMGGKNLFVASHCSLLTHILHSFHPTMKILLVSVTKLQLIYWECFLHNWGQCNISL